MKEIDVYKPELQVIESWRKAVKLSVDAGEISSATGVTYQRGMTKFMAYLLENGIESVTPDVVRTWTQSLREIGMKPSAINTWLAGVKRFFGWAVQTGVILTDPTASIKGVKRHNTNRKHLRDALTDHEVLLVLRKPDVSTLAGKRDYAWLSLMAFCALREIEISHANIEDLSTINGLPVLRVQGKGSSEKDEQAVIYSSTAQSALYDWLGVWGKTSGALFPSLSDRSYGKALGTSAIRHLGQQYFHQAGVIDARKTLHSLRHSAISKVAKHDILKARQVARHTSIETTMIYVHEADRLDNPGEQFIEYRNGES